MKPTGNTTTAPSPGLLVMAGGLCWFAGLLLTPGGPVAVADELQHARQVVGQLVAASRIYDQREMSRASDQLATIGKPAVPALMQALDDVDGNVRWQAIVTLGRIGDPHATVATRKLIEALDDIDPDVRTSAADTLGQLHTGNPAVQGALRPLTEDPHGQVRAAAWWALWQLGKNRQATAQLVKLLGDKDWMVNQAASKYLSQIGPPAVAPLIATLQNAPHRGQAAAAEALAQMGVSAHPAVTALIPLLNHDKPAVATAASRALGQIGPAAIPALIKELQQDRRQSRLLSIKSMAAIGPPAATAIPQLVQRLQHPDPQTQRLCVQALGSMGPSAAAAVDELTSLLADPQADLRGATCQALGQLGAVARTAEAQLSQLSRRDPIDFVRAAARQACQQLASSD